MSTRIQKIKDTYSTQFKERLEQEKVDISLDSAWDILISTDPTKNQKNVRWLVETYLNKGYLWEDIMGGPTSKVAETLVEFDKHKRNLEPAERSLMKYQTLGSLWASIKPYVGQLTTGEEKKIERDKAYDEAEVVIDREDGLKIIVPNTEYSAKWFGRGTRWCTSADNDNMFSYYASKAPLFVIFMPDGNKLQVWQHENDIQFMNEDDAMVNLNYIEENWNILEPVCRWTKHLECIPKKFRNREMCMEAVKQNGSSLQHIPRYLRDYELCLEAVKSNGQALQYVTETLRDYKICMAAVKQNGWALKYVPIELRDKKICMEAINQDRSALHCVPEKFRDYPMCMEAIQNHGRALSFVPEALIDYEMCMEAVKQDGIALAYTPISLNNYTIYLTAVKQNGYALEYLPEELRDHDMCMEAVKSNGLALCYVPVKLRDYKICMEAIKNNALSLQHVPEELKDYELCMEAVKQNGWALKYVPIELKDKKICMEAMNQDKQILLFVPEEFKENMTIIPEDTYRKEIERMKESLNISLLLSPTI